MTGSDAADANKHDRKADATPPSGFSSQDEESQIAPEDMWPPWRYWPLLISLLFNVLLISGLMKGLDWPVIQSGILEFDLFIFLRVLFARIRNETGYGWMVYLALIWLAPFFIPYALEAGVVIRRALLHL